MRILIWPIRRAGSWREATPNVIIMLMNIGENETIMFG